MRLSGTPHGSVRTPIDHSPDTDFGLCLLQRLSRRLVAARACRALDPRPQGEEPHIVNSSIRFGSLIRFRQGPHQPRRRHLATVRDLSTGAARREKFTTR